MSENLSSSEKENFPEKNTIKLNNLPELLSPHLKEIIDRAKKNGDLESLKSLQKQFMISEKENNVLPCELEDPLGANRYQITGRLIHQYKNRVLLLTTGNCFANCRFCFRRCSPAKQKGPLSEKEIEDVCSYLAIHPEIQEILFSGGDCLTFSDYQLNNLIQKVRTAHAESLKAVKLNTSNADLLKNNDTVFDKLLIRICTRSPVFNPSRFTNDLIYLLKKNYPVWVIPHINHPAELYYSPETVDVFSKFRNAGIPIQSQTVLLRGVNDTVETLASLFHDLTNLGVKPGYLFQGDLVPGTSHFRVSIQKGIQLYEKLRQELSGLSTPVYAVDLPGGGGKINLLQADSDQLLLKVKKLIDSYEFIDKNGKKWIYPIEN